MKLNKTMPLFAIVVALALGIGSFAFSQKNDKNEKAVTEKKEVLENYYYNFTGSPGQEDNEALWELIEDDDFENSTCNKEKNGCVIKTISGETSAPAHPAYVPVTGTGPAMTPVIDNVNIEDARFKNQ